MGKKIKMKARLTIGERQNWRCCFCGVRMIARGLQDPHEYAHQNGYKPLLNKATNPLTRHRTSNVFRIETKGNSQDNLAAACTWCVSAKADMSLNAWLHNVEMLVLAGTHPCHQSPDYKNSVSFKPRKPRVPKEKKQRRPQYAHSELM